MEATVVPSPVRDALTDLVGGRRVIVLGLGVTGAAVARELALSGAHVLASDAGGDADAAGLRDLDVDVELGTHDRALEALADADLVLPSPGIPPSADVLRRAVGSGLPVWSEIELASRIAPAPVWAVTGTNGKTTVTRMIGAALVAAGRDAVVCGNIGDTFLEAVLEHPDAEAFAVEVSSFQLAACETFHPRVSVITNVAPDHLDWHGSMDEYLAAKGRIAARQTPDDRFVYPAAQPELADLAPYPQRVPFSLDPMTSGDGVWSEGADVVARIAGEPVRFAGLAGLIDRGRPFVEDGLAAAAAVLGIGAEPEAVGRALGSFTPDRHRIELVRETGGVRFYDDSKATNPHATVAALRGFEHVVLLAGGRNKGLDLRVLAAEAGRLRGVVAIGEAAPEVVRAFASTDVPVRTADGMTEAVGAAAGLARPGDAVLLSPGCASFDRYRNYAERGDAFRDACEALGGEEDR